MTLTTTTSVPVATGGPPPFAHPAPGPPPPMNDTTRRLCAAAYLDDGFAYRVIQEAVADDQRAVPPSLGFDVEPVIRHSFRARGLLLARDGALAAILVAAFLLVPFSAIAWVTFAWAVRHLRAGRNSTVRTRVAVGAIAGAAVLYCCLGMVSPLSLLKLLDDSPAPQYDPYGRYGTADQDPVGGLLAGVLPSFDSSLLLSIFALPFICGLATVACALVARLRTFWTLTRTLAPESSAPPPALPSARVERRVAWIAAAQRGNTSLHSTDPLMGSGDPVLLWSMALLLQGRAVHDGRHVARDAEFDPRAVSALTLQRQVRDAVLRLQDPALPPHQRVPGVYVMDRIVADGERFQGDPLIDPATRTALQLASAEAIAAIAEQPQGGVRHYTHMLVGVEGREVTANGRLVLPAQSQDIIVSAYLHVAVEGGKLYLEFIGTVLPPVRHEFKIVDRLRPDTGYLVARALPRLLRDWLHSTDAPRRFVRSVRQLASINARARAAHENALRFKSYEYGARLSVRELGAEPHTRTFLQDLDAAKYLKLVERTVLDTVLDYLERAGVDTAEYRTQMTTVQNSQTILNSPTFTGPAAFGTGAFAQQMGAHQAGATR